MQTNHNIRPMKLSIVFPLIILIFSSCMKTQNNNSVPAEGFIPVVGGKVWYKIVGQNTPGIPVLVIHGGPGAPHDYLEPLEQWAETRPVIFYDQLGCGNSEVPTDTSLWTVERFVNELEMVRNALNIKQVHLFGQSWGTMLAVEYMLRKKPEGVVSMVLSAPYLSTPMWEKDQQAWVHQLPEETQQVIFDTEKSGRYDSPAYQEAMNVFYQKHVCRMEPWPDCVNRAFEKMGLGVYHHMWGPSEFTMTGILKNADLTEQLQLIKVPVLFTCGELDESTPASVKYFQSKLPGSSVHIFEGASHMHHLEKEEEFHRVVTAFMQEKEENHK